MMSSTVVVDEVGRHFLDRLRIDVADGDGQWQAVVSQDLERSPLLGRRSLHR